MGHGEAENWSTGKRDDVHLYVASRLQEEQVDIGSDRLHLGGINVDGEQFFDMNVEDDGVNLSGLNVVGDSNFNVQVDCVQLEKLVDVNIDEYRAGMSDGEYEGDESDKEIVVDIDFLTDNDDDELQEARDNVRHFRRMSRKEDAEGEINVDVVESMGNGNAEDTFVDKGASSGENDKVPGYESEYIESEDDASFCTGDDDSDEGVDRAVRRKSLYNRFDPKVIVPQWEVGQIFSSLKEFKQGVIKYAIATGKNVKWKKNEPSRCRVACVSGCKFILFCSWCNTANAFRLKTYNPEHSCTRSNKIKVVNQDFLVEYFRETIKDNPTTKVCEIKRCCKKVLKIDVNISKCRRVKKVILKEMEGNYLEQYSRLYDYAEELKRSNPGTTVVLDTDKERNPTVEFFQRFYVCFKCCKYNWIVGCRPVIGLDGCFLKGLCKGQLLCAIGRDANNQMFPIAWAVVRVENNENWSWFCKLLAADIEYNEGKHLTFISDMQKGILNAIEDVFPNAEHRLCARHVFAAWQKKHRGEDFRLLFWMAARSTYEQQLEDRLKEMDALSTGSAKALCNSYPVERWCKAYFQTFSKCDIVDNNLAETFNGWIMNARSKSIIHMLDEIRVMVMTRLQVKRDLIEKWTQQYAPRVMIKLDKNKEVAMSCEVVWNGEGGFEVVDGADKHVVDKDKSSCTCRSWDLTGIPCAHAVSTIWHMGQEPLDYVSDWYHKDTYMKTYQCMMQPVRGPKQWKKTSIAIVMPPAYRILPGRPKKKRIRDKDEPHKRNGKMMKMSQKGRKMHCSLCRGTGHNKHSCNMRGTQPTSLEVSTHPTNMGIQSQEEVCDQQNGESCRRDMRKTNKGKPKEKLKKSKVVEGVGCLVTDSGVQIVMAGNGQRRVLSSGSSSVPRSIPPQSPSPSIPFVQHSMEFRGKPATTTRQLKQRQLDNAAKRRKKFVTNDIEL